MGRWSGLGIGLLLGWAALGWAGPPAEVSVHRVLDGDTLEVTDGTTIYKIRLIGVGAAERYSVVPCAKRWAEAAMRYLSLLVTDQPVRLALDVVPQDKYGRWLAYLYVDDVFVNGRLLQAGLAVLADSGKNRQQRDTLRALAREAQVWRRGLWEGS